MSNGTAVVLGLGLVGVAAVIYLRRQAATAVADPCAGLAVDPRAYAACKLASTDLGRKVLVEAAEVLGKGADAVKRGVEQYVEVVTTPFRGLRGKSGNRGAGAVIESRIRARALGLTTYDHRGGA